MLIQIQIISFTYKNMEEIKINKAFVLLYNREQEKFFLFEDETGLILPSFIVEKEEDVLNEVFELCEKLTKPIDAQFLYEINTESLKNSSYLIEISEDLTKKEEFVGFFVEASIEALDEKLFTDPMLAISLQIFKNQQIEKLVLAQDKLIADQKEQIKNLLTKIHLIENTPK